jgi:hypothetical protein
MWQPFVPVLAVHCSAPHRSAPDGVAIESSSGTATTLGRTQEGAATLRRWMSRRLVHPPAGAGAVPSLGAHGMA